MFTDNKDFYPTPKELFYQLLNGNRYLSGRILEPSAGKGDLIKYIRELRGGKSVKIDAIENDPRLSNILMGEGINVVWDDFLSYKTYKQYDYIIMNPPFSNGVDHILKALELAENQLGYCVIYAILNKETINNAYSSKRQELLRKLDEHGADIRYVKDAFTQAERKTDVEVALITVKVEKKGAGKSIYDSIPFNTSHSTESTLETALSTYVKHSEIQAKLNDIERLVLEYETACELARNTYKAIRDKASFFSYIGEVNRREGEVGTPFSYVISNKFSAVDLSEEIDRLRQGYWKLILDTDEFKKLLTNEAIQELNKRLSIADEMEINLTNIRMLLLAIGANRREMLIESVVSIFKKITKYHMNEYSSNVHYYNGWKTNDAYKINKKVIIPIKWGFDPAWDFKADYKRINSDARAWIDDIVKAFQLIDPNVESEFTAQSEQEFSNNLLRFKMFMNGNIHVWFLNIELLDKLNYLCGSHFGWIPSEGEQKENPRAREFVVKEFGENAMKVTLLEATE